MQRDDLPLTGADCFLRAFDDEVQRTAGVTHNSQLILRLGPGFDLDRFREVVGRVIDANPVLHSPIRRPFGMGAPVYRRALANPGTLPILHVHEQDGAPAKAVPEVFFDRLNGRFDGHRGNIACFDAVPYDGGRAGTDLSMSWLHMLFDGAGCEWFVRFVDRVARGECAPDELPQTEEDAAPGLPQGVPSNVRGRRAMRWQNAMKDVTRKRANSLAGPLRPVKQHLRYEVESLSPEETVQAQARIEKATGFVAPMAFHLACAVRAYDAVYRARGLDPGSYVVPLPVDLRPKGQEPALFRTRVSLIWFRVEPDLVRDFDALLEEIRRQRREAIREDRIEDGAIAMDFARMAPMRVYTMMARRSMQGELCSFFFAFTGRFAGGLERFLDTDVRDAFTSPSVPPSPGTAVTTSLFADRMNVLQVYQDGVLSEKDRRVFFEHLRSDLLS